MWVEPSPCPFMSSTRSGQNRRLFSLRLRVEDAFEPGAQLEKCFVDRIHANKEVWIRRRDSAPLDQRLKIEDPIPVVLPVQKNAGTVGEFLRLLEGEDFEELVERAESPWENHQRPCHVGEPELPHEEVMELEVQAFCDVRICSLFMRKADIETNCLSAGFVCPAVRRLHDAGPAAGT